MQDYLVQDKEISIVSEEFKIYDLRERTRLFAYDCYDLCEMLPNSYMANHIKGQLLRCSSSVAANYRATQLAQSIATFIAKISIVLEEADESEFWLKFIIDKKIIENDLVNKLHAESKELVSIFKKSRITAQTNLRNKKAKKI